MRGLALVVVVAALAGRVEAEGPRERRTIPIGETTHVGPLELPADANLLVDLSRVSGKGELREVRLPKGALVFGLFGGRVELEGCVLWPRPCQPLATVAATGTLARETVVGGFTLAAGNARVTMEGIAPKHRDVVGVRGRLARALEVEGLQLAAGTGIDWRGKQGLFGLELLAPMTLGTVLVTGGIRFFPGGKHAFRAFSLAQPATVGRTRWPRGTAIVMDEPGRIATTTLPAGAMVRIAGISFGDRHATSALAFHPNGRVAEGQVAVVQRIGKRTIPAGTRVRFDAAGRPLPEEQE